jgi:hypothetical protein
MVHRKVLKKTGCTPERLREIFTCKDQTHANWKIRKKFEERIQDRLHQGAAYTMQFAKKWQAVDMAWDSTPILDETVPLMLWAQGKIKDNDLLERFKKLNVADKYCTNEKVEGQTVIKLNVPRLYEVSINIIRTYCTRGMAAQTARFSNLWPYFKYEPRGTDDVAKLRGDALSQRVDAMADAYNYRHNFPQSDLQKFLYGRSVMFTRSAWDTKMGWRPKDPKADEIEMESYCEREGVDFVTPHPSRLYWDLSSPLPNINTDNGPSYIGFWDVVPFRNIWEGDYFNLKEISVTDGFCSLIDGNKDYFNYYFDKCVLNFPDRQHDPSARNDRVRQIGRYAGNESDKGCVLVQHYEKINPHREGIGTLNADVWVRFVIAGDTTVVAAEFLPSRPAAYGGINEKDDRVISQSRAMELMGYQDQMTNLWSQLLFTLKTGMIQIWCVDKNVLDKGTIEYIEKMMKGDTYYATPHALFYDGSKLAEAGFTNPSTNSRAILQIVQAQIQQQLDNIMKSISELLNLCERLMVISPNELGQPNPREVSARETSEIATSVNAISSFISDGIDEQRAAVKRIIYESLRCMSCYEVRVPVIGRYNVKTIKAAGFELPESYTNAPDDQIVTVKTTITGTVDELEFEYYFDSRDGAERAVNTQTAQALGNVIAQFIQIPALAKAIGKRRLFEWANEVTRLSGAAFDLKLDPDEDDSIETEDAAAVPEMAARLDKLEQMMTQVLAAIQGKPALPPEGGPAADPSAPPALIGQ